MAYIVDLDAFHGPMDLLLYLIEKNEVDIYDIPVAVISDQYLGYLQSTGDLELERLGDFLLMASYLLNLKSRMLLPRHGLEEEEEADLDPREELVRSLLDYKKYKKVADYLLARQSGELKRVFFRNNIEIANKEEIVADLKVLFRSYQNLLREKLVADSDLNLPSEDINIGEKMDEIIGRLQNRPEGLVFQDLFSGVISKREALALFLALLELIRLQKIFAYQAEYFSEIIISVRVAV